MTNANPSILQLDTKAITVLAHPLRSRLLTELRMHGPATATNLARTLETNTGATSYHLRKLASVGLVEETEDGRGRERPWRAATEFHGWTEHEIAYDQDAKAASDWLRRYYLRSFVEHYSTGSTSSSRGRSSGRTSRARVTSPFDSARHGSRRSTTTSRRCTSATANGRRPGRHSKVTTSRSSRSSSTRSHSRPDDDDAHHA